MGKVCKTCGRNTAYKVQTWLTSTGEMSKTPQEGNPYVDGGFNETVDIYKCKVCLGSFREPGVIVYNKPALKLVVL